MQSCESCLGRTVVLTFHQVRLWRLRLLAELASLLPNHIKWKTYWHYSRCWEYALFCLHSCHLSKSFTYIHWNSYLETEQKKKTELECWMLSEEKLDKLVLRLNILHENPWVALAGNWGFSFHIYCVSKEGFHCMNGKFIHRCQECTCNIGQDFQHCLLYL